jgi:protoporphyrinogen oxidase
MAQETAAETRKRIGIVGAGIGGLSAAWELARQPGVTVEVYERDPYTGGLAGWFEVGGTTLERFYHHIYRVDEDLIGLIRELGLEDHLVFRATNTGCFYVNAIYRLSSPLDLLRFKPLGFLDRLRLGMLAVKTRTVRDWRELDEITAKQWMIESAGQRVYDVVWAPLFRAKFGKFADQVSAAWLWSKFVQRGGSRSKTGREELGYFAGGYGKLFTELERRLEAAGARIHLARPVEEVAIEGDRVVGLQVDGRLERFDAVLVTAQLPDFVTMAPGLPAEYREKLGRIGFLANTCLVLHLNHALSDTYWVNITDVECPFVGVIEQTNLLGPEYYQGGHLAYISRYMERSDPYYRMTADELYAAYLPYLKRIFPEFREEWVIGRYLWREPHAQSIVSVGFRHLIPDHRTPVRNLYLSTMAQIFPEDRQMSNGVKLARRTARMILQDLGLG